METETSSGRYSGNLGYEVSTPKGLIYSTELWQTVCHDNVSHDGLPGMSGEGKEEHGENDRTGKGIL